jgi:hypothetical protein
LSIATENKTSTNSPYRPATDRPAMDGSFTVEVTGNGCWAFNGTVMSSSQAAGMIVRLKLFIGDRREN